MSHLQTATGNFASGDTIKIKISIGEITFVPEHTLIINILKDCKLQPFFIFILLK